MRAGAGDPPGIRTWRYTRSKSGPAMPRERIQSRSRSCEPEEHIKRPFSKANFILPPTETRQPPHMPVGDRVLIEGGTVYAAKNGGKTYSSIIGRFKITPRPFFICLSESATTLRCVSLCQRR